jgi:hypothetical protein
MRTMPVSSSDTPKSLTPVMGFVALGMVAAYPPLGPTSACKLRRLGESASWRARRVRLPKRDTRLASGWT